MQMCCGLFAQDIVCEASKIRCYTTAGKYVQTSVSNEPCKQHMKVKTCVFWDVTPCGVHRFLSP
jgi:hypothetical protein